MSIRFDDNERVHQFFLGISVQHTLKFIVNRVLSEGECAQIQNSCPKFLHKNKTPKVSIACYEQPTLFLGGSEQVFVVRLRETQFSHTDHVVSQVTQEASRYGVDVLVKQELHAGTVVR